jgi:hypothetical protein
VSIIIYTMPNDRLLLISHVNIRHMELSFVLADPGWGDKIAA